MADITSVFNIPVAVAVLCWGLFRLDLISFESAVTWPLLSVVGSVLLIGMVT